MLIKIMGDNIIKEYYNEQYFKDNDIIIGKILRSYDIEKYFKNNILTKDKLVKILYSLVYLCKEWNEYMKKHYELKIYELIEKLKDEKVFLNIVYELWEKDLHKIVFSDNVAILGKILSFISNPVDLEKVIKIYKTTKWFDNITKREITNVLNDGKFTNIVSISNPQFDEKFKSMLEKLSLIRTFKEEDFDYFLENINLFEEKDRKKIVEVYLGKSSYKVRMSTFLDKIKDTSIIVENKDFLMNYARREKKDLITNYHLFSKMIFKYWENNKDIFEIFPINEDDINNDITLLAFRLISNKDNKEIIDKLLYILEKTNYWEISTILELPSSRVLDLSWKTVKFFNITTCHFNRSLLIDRIKNIEDWSRLLVEINKHRLHFTKNIKKVNIRAYVSLDTIFFMWLSDWEIKDINIYINTAINIYELNKDNIDYVYLYIDKFLVNRNIQWDINNTTLDRLIWILKDFPDLDDENKNTILRSYTDYYINSVESWNKNLQIFFDIFLKKYYPEFFNFFNS